jgi:hypothetical protein
MIQFVKLQTYTYRILLAALAEGGSGTDLDAANA